MDNYKLLLKEILNGVSEVNSTDTSFSFYIKHINQIDTCDLEEIYQKSYEEAVKNSIKPLSEREEEIIKSGEWDKDKDKIIKDEEFFIESITVQISKSFKQSEIEELKKTRLESENKVRDIKKEKLSIIGNTADYYANKKLNDYYLFSNSYKDKELKFKLFTEEEFDLLQNEEINKIGEIFKKTINRFNTKNMQKLSLSQFFMPFFNLCNDDAAKLFGRRVFDLSYYQIELYNNAAYFKHIMSSIGESIPKEYLDNPEKLIEIYTVKKNANDMEQKAGIDKSSNISYMGAKSSDLKHISKGAQIIDSAYIDKIAKEKYGGKMTFQDMIKEGIA